MKRIIAALLVLSLLLVAGCGKPAPTSQQGKVSISVTDDNGIPVKGATVTLMDSDGKALTATSNANGAAVFNALPYGDYDVASSMGGYADGADTITVDSGSQEVSLSMTSTAASSTGSGQDAVAIGDASVIDSLTSYHYKWTILGEGDTKPSTIEGGFEKPDNEYMISRDKDGKTDIEFYKVGGTVKMGSGGSWSTYTGDEAKNFGYGSSFVSTLSGDYSYIKGNQSDWKKSNGGSVNGYETDKYVYSVSYNGVTVTATASVINSGEFKGVMTRYEIYYQNDTDASKRSGYTNEIFDLNKPIGIELP
jgi:hypothetical protein